jgi:mycofactocin biosynthetic radical S-adenosylmethionine protein MftC
MAAPPVPLITYGPTESEGIKEKAYILLQGSGPEWCAANETAVDIARRLEDGQTVDAIAAGLAARFGISLEAARNDAQQVADRLTELGLLENRLPPTFPAPALQSLYLHLTTRCNLACPHCYVNSPSQGDLPTSQVLRLVDELRDAGGNRVTLSGGEPLLHPDIRGILRYAAARAQVQLLSNGTRLDRDWVAFLAQEVNPDIQLSLDGSRAEIHDRIRGPGSFAATLKAVGLLQEAGLGGQITLAATIMRPNLKDLPEIMRLAQALGVAQVRFLPVRRVGRAKQGWEAIGGLKVEEYEEFFDYAAGLRGGNRPTLEVNCGLSGFLLEMPGTCAGNDTWCPVGRSLIVDVWGQTYPCVLMMRDEFKLGNVFEQSLAGMMQSASMARTVKSLTARRLQLGACAACSWRNLCQGGCMGQALDETGTIWNTDRFCPYRQKAYQRAFDRILENFGQEKLP